MKQLRWYDYLTINLFWLGLNIRNTALGSIFMPYLVGIFAPEAIKNTALGAMRSAGLVIAMLVQPAAGLLSDRSTSRFGRRRPYILVGALFDCLFLAAIALSQTYWALLIAVLLIQFSSNISHGPLQGLIPDLVPEDQRGRCLGRQGHHGTAAGHPGRAYHRQDGRRRKSGFGHLCHRHFPAGSHAYHDNLCQRNAAAGETDHTVLAADGARPRDAGWDLIGAVAGLVGGGLVGGLAGLITLIFAEKATALSVGVGVGGAVAMIVAVVAGVWAGCLGTLGKGARKQSSFVWWIVNRLMFLAAALPSRVPSFTFVMYAFKLSNEGASSLTGSLTSIIGIFIVLTALASGWISDRLGRTRLGCHQRYCGGGGKCFAVDHHLGAKPDYRLRCGDDHRAGNRAVHDCQLGARHGPCACGRSRTLSGSFEPCRGGGGYHWRRDRRAGGRLYQPLLHGTGIFRRLCGLCCTLRLEYRHLTGHA